MQLPFDFEDIVGVALADVLRRAGAIAATIFAALALAVVSLAAADLVDSVITRGFRGFGFPEVDHPGWIFLSPFLSGWGALYVPFLVGLLIFWTKADQPGLRAWSIGVAALSLLYLASVWVWHEKDAAFIVPATVIWAGCGGAMVFFSIILDQRRRARAEEHLLGVTIENEQRRQRLRDEQGIVVAGSEYLADEAAAPPYPASARGFGGQASQK